MKTQIFKPILENSRYLVSNTGTIIDTLTNKELKHYSNRGSLPGSYLFVRIWIDGKIKTRYVHRLVMQAHVGFPAEGYQVDHIDHNTYNNTLENLRYVTRKENRNRRLVGKIPTRFTPLMVVKCRVLYSKGYSIGQLSRFFDANWVNIYNIVKRVTWKQHYLELWKERVEARLDETLDIKNMEVIEWHE